MTSTTSEKPITRMDEFFARYLPRERKRVLRAMADGETLQVSVRLSRHELWYPSSFTLGLVSALREAGLIERICGWDGKPLRFGEAYKITEKGRLALEEVEHEMD